jgi:hypothetical protein
MAEQSMDREIQPQFPPSRTRENSDYIEWGDTGLIALTSGPCVLLSYFRGDQLLHVGSIELSPYNVSCCKFHPTMKLLALGDSHGRAFI